MNRMLRVCCFLLVFQLLCTPPTSAQNKPAAKKKTPPPFRWVNPLPERLKLPGLSHKTFVSPSMKIDVGYCIYLPAEYGKPQNKNKRFPVVYYLHGGRPGSETKSVWMSSYIQKAIEDGVILPTIYVFVNGGHVSHYNYPEKKSMGEDVFIKELIPHIDKTYRTIAGRSGRGLEGFSQGGRGTARIMFKHPHLFCSAAPGGGGHATEKRISEENGKESENLIFAPGYNTYDLARKYAAGDRIPFSILVYVGNKGFNYQNNLEYMKFLTSLKIPFKRLIIPDAPHSGRIIYEKKGNEIMTFHADNFKKGAAKRKSTSFQVQPPPKELKLDPFYKKSVLVGGFPVIGSEKVSDYALKEAAYLISIMLKDRPDILQALVKNKTRFVIMATSERTSDIPEHSDLEPHKFWDRRARGLGATPQRPATSCGEENLLGLEGDPYHAENILVHEFAHTMHHMGLDAIDKTFDPRLKQIYESAMKKKLWEGKYAATNRAEYWAEGVQSYFDTNRPPDHDHNHVDTREELEAHDPDLAHLVAEVFRHSSWRYQKPTARKSPTETAHLKGFDIKSSPKFAWDPELQKWYDAYQKQQAQKKKEAAVKDSK